VKALAWILTAAAVLIGADVFVMSTADPLEEVTSTKREEPQTTGPTGMPPPDAY
jgi:hypothetical protein